ncbi:1-phosphatidylinositol phosphodiesterase-like [Megalops cyprinoides]|uniref:1-phosphatidylinositol phosphodiesterase-like n=1 Tax=Megalops cyprinoides TaxID=118141 RepID=UPI001863D19B|nr:1-phosphatidylinositol phosphodiesterase-like [Megalops cyprinoides]
MHQGSSFNDYKTLNSQSRKVDWMSAIANDKPLSAVTIPGTHESLSLYGGPLLRCQFWRLDSQLDAGLRYFDIHVEGHVFGNEISVADGIFGKHEPFTNVMKTLKNFLEMHRSETVLLRVTAHGLNKRKAIKNLKKLLKQDGGVWVGPSVPSMGDARGKIIVVQSPDLPLGVLNRDTYVAGDDKFKSHENKMKRIRKHLAYAGSICASTVVLTESSASWLLKGPRGVAEMINPDLYNYLNDLQGSKDRPKCLGVIAMDFPGPDLIKAIIDFNFELEN